MKTKKKWSLTSYCYLLPCMLVFAVFLFYPFVKTIYLSLYKTNKYGQAKLFVGLENYIDLLTSASFQNSLKVTLIYVVIVVFGSMLLGLVTAVLCKNTIKRRRNQRQRPKPVVFLYLWIKKETSEKVSKNLIFSFFRKIRKIFTFSELYFPEKSTSAGEFQSPEGCRPRWQQQT